MTISRATWAAVLSLNGGLVDQTREFRSAMRWSRGAPESARTALDVAAASMPQEARFVVTGLADFIEHMSAVDHGDFERATRLAVDAEARFDLQDGQDLRRLDSVVLGIATGSLVPDKYIEAYDLVHGVLAGPHALAVLAKFRRGRRTWREWVSWKLTDLRQTAHLARNGEEPRSSVLPRRTAGQSV